MGFEGKVCIAIRLMGGIGGGGSRGEVLYVHLLGGNEISERAEGQAWMAIYEGRSCSAHLGKGLLVSYKEALVTDPAGVCEKWYWSAKLIGFKRAAVGRLK